MSKLWIVHRNPRRLEALARLSGLAAPDLVQGEPTSDVFAEASPPAAILVGVEDDFELELDFLHRLGPRLERSQRILLARPEDVDEVERLFAASRAEILDGLPSDRALRARVVAAVAHRSAESLAARRDRERISERFNGWFADLEIPGLFRALDPALAGLPLLVRGVPGSGRALVARYVEQFRVRAPAGPTLRVHAREIETTDDLVARLLARERDGRPDIRTIWIDEIDSLDVATQRSLAEWIRLATAPAGSVGRELRWIATAAEPGFPDRLDQSLEQAFAPLCVNVPALADQPDVLGGFADRVAADWSRSVGGPRRRIGASAIRALEAYAWSGDRAAVEAVLRSSLAASMADPVEAEDLFSSHAAEPVADAVFAEPEPEPEPASEVDAPSPEASPAPASLSPSDAATHVEASAPEDAIDEFEQAFLAGLPESRPEREPARDLSAEMSDAAFVLSEGEAPPPAPTTSVASPATAALAPTAPTEAETEAEATREAPEASTPPAAAPDSRPSRGETDWRRLARSLSHEIRNPLVSIRTFAELLPEHFGDPSFRERFTELVGRDVAHIDDVVTRLARAAEREKEEAGPVDVSALIERLLDERRERIGQGRLLVLRELERDDPVAWVDAHGLEVALSGLLDRALDALPERGDLFVATRRIERAADGAPRLRVLLRHHNPELGAGDGSGLEELGSAANVLEYVLAETIIEAGDGTLTIDSTDAQETLILVDLRTPA